MKTLTNLRKLTRPFFLAMVLCLGLTGVAAAAPADSFPVGIVDFMALINNHPDTTAANAALKAEQEQIRKEFETKSAGLNDKDKLALDRRLGQRIEQKRQELLKPIVDGINAAMTAVAAEKGLAMVVHKNSVALGGQDITAAVLAKLSGK